MVRKNLLKYLGSCVLAGLLVTSAGANLASFSAYAERSIEVDSSDDDELAEAEDTDGVPAEPTAPVGSAGGEANEPEDTDGVPAESTDDVSTRYIAEPKAVNAVFDNLEHTGLAAGYDVSNLTVEYFKVTDDAGEAPLGEGVKPIAAGLYRIYLTPKAGYAWQKDGKDEGNDTAARTLEFRIAQKVLKGHLEDATITYGDEFHNCSLNSFLHVDGKPVTEWQEEIIRACVLVDFGYPSKFFGIYKYDLSSPYTLEVNPNYSLEIDNLDTARVTVKPWAVIEKPSTEKVTYIYDGKVHVPVASTEYYRVTYWKVVDGEIRDWVGEPTEVGEYIANVDPIVGAAWQDPSVTDWKDLPAVESFDIPFEIVAADGDAAGSAAKNAGAESLASTGSETATLGLFAGLAVLAGAGTLVARRRAGQ